MPRKSCRRSAPTPISRSARAWRGASRACSIASGSASSTKPALAKVDRTATVVFVINHRSNMDYILVTYMAAATSALSYAVGEWARVWGLQSLIRSMGAYFVRRDSGEPLYRKVLSRYVQMSTAAGVTQAMFPEGGLTRDGTLRPPKLGLFSYMVSGFDPHGPRDVVFVPVGLNYDRVLEDRLQTGAIATPAGEKPRFKFNALVLAGFLLRQTWLRITGRWHRFGYACVSFGAPVSLRAYLTERGVDLRTLSPTDRSAEIGKLGQIADAAGRRCHSRAPRVSCRDRAPECAGGQAIARTVGLRDEGARSRPDERSGGARRPYPYPPAGPRVRRRGRPAHAGAAPHRPGTGRSLSHQSCGNRSLALLCQLDRASRPGRSKAGAGHRSPHTCQRGQRCPN